MFESIEKLKYLGVATLERFGDYLELFQLELAVQRRSLSSKLLAVAIAGLSATLTLIFLGIAVLATYWDTRYRIPAAWAIVGFFALLLLGSYLYVHTAKPASSALDVLRQQLREDVELIKEIL